MSKGVKSIDGHYQPVKNAHSICYAWFSNDVSFMLLILCFQEESDNDTNESDGSDNSDDSKLAALSLRPPPPQRPLSTSSGAQVGVRETKRFRGWEILGGLREGQTAEQKPEKFEGFIMKRRKWPMKGWHKVS